MRPPATESANRPLLQPGTPRIRLLFAVGFISVTALLPRSPGPIYIVPSLIVAIAWAVARMPMRYAVGRLLIAEVFLLGIALFTLFSPRMLPVAITAFLKTNLCVLMISLLTWTTPFHEIIKVLRDGKVPPIMVTTLALMYRYLPVLQHESRRMQRARASRTFNTGRGLAWAALASILGSLFIRTADRAERIYLAMCARGWK